MCDYMQYCLFANLFWLAGVSLAPPLFPPQCLPTILSNGMFLLFTWLFGYRSKRIKIRGDGPECNEITRFSLYLSCCLTGTKTIKISVWRAVSPQSASKYANKSHCFVTRLSDLLRSTRSPQLLPIVGRY